jgi:hypothetical protein
LILSSEITFLSVTVFVPVDIQLIVPSWFNCAKFFDLDQYLRLGVKKNPPFTGRVFRSNRDYWLAAGASGAGGAIIGAP